MFKWRRIIFIVSFIIALFTVLISCNHTGTAPFAPGNTANLQPLTKPLHFPASSRMQWIAGKEDTFPLPIKKDFDINKLPAKPFYEDGFVPFSKPVVTEKTNFTSIIPVHFGLDTIPEKKLRYKFIKIDPPIKSKAGVAKSKAPATKNILQFGRDEGLPGGVIHTIFQDSSGIYWLGTGRGLCRYDGEYSELYSFVSKEPQGAPSIDQITQDKKGRLWIRTASRGIYVFDYARQSVINIEMGTYDMAPDALGRSWLLGVDGFVYRVNADQLTMQRISSEMIGDTIGVARVLPGKKHQLIFRTAGGISIADLQKNTIVRWQTGSQKTAGNVFYTLLKKDGTILFSTDKGLDLLDPASGTLTHYSTEQGLDFKPFPYSPTEDSQGRIWHSTGDSGIEVIDVIHGSHLRLKKESGLSENVITCIYQDKKAKLWMGTETGGINVIDTRIAVNHLSTMQGLGDNSVW